jgi:methionine synthase II (cobalamin-independent)
MDTLRADHVGSLLRPAELQRARESYEAGALDRIDLTDVEDRAILAALQRQRAAGVGVHTDGEFRRGVYMTVVTDALDGFAPDGGSLLHWRIDSGEVPEHVVDAGLGEVTGALRVRHRVAGHEAAFLRLVSTKTGHLETRDELLRRIEDAARYVPVERLAVSPQCGFASNFRGNPLTEYERWRKQELVATIAGEVRA